MQNLDTGGSCLGSYAPWFCFSGERGMKYNWELSTGY